MNPLIEKFWNDAGYEVARSDPDFDKCNVADSEWRYLWFLRKDGQAICLAGVSEIFYGPGRPDTVKCHIYLFDNKEYLEADMLRIIGLKVFI